MVGVPLPLSYALTVLEAPGKGREEGRRDGGIKASVSSPASAAPCSATLNKLFSALGLSFPIL